MEHPGAGLSLPLARQSIGNIVATEGSQVLAGTFHNVYVNSARSEEHAARTCEETLFQTFPFADRDTYGDVVPGTCDWITATHQYQLWLQGNERQLWIYGSPGKGKTFLSIFLTKELERQAQEYPGSEVIYFFCSSQNDRRDNAGSILRGLLYQLVAKQRDLATSMVQYFDTPEKAQEAVQSPDILWAILEQTIQTSKLDKIFCVIDGLDECDENSQRWMSSSIRSLKSNRSKIHILVVSRDIHCLRGIAPQIKLDLDHDDQIRADIENFISFKFEEISNWVRLSSQFQEAVKKQLNERSEGTFLWIGLAINELQSCQTATEIEQTLKSLPAGLLAFYARMLQQIRPEEKAKCAEMLHWMAAAVRPLSLVELAATLGTKPTPLVSSQQAILDRVTMCRFIAKETLEGAGLIHQSAQDYLFRRGANETMFLRDFCIDPSEAHLKIAWFCLDTIARYNLQDAPVELDRKGALCLRSFLWQQHCLLPYAVEAWIEHANYSSNVLKRLIQHPSKFFEKRSQLRDAWWRVYSQIKHRRIGGRDFELPTLHQACYLGLSAWAQVLIARDKFRLRAYSMINRSDSEGLKPLHHVVHQGHLETVKCLLDLGADIQSEGPPGSTALSYAIYKGQLAMVQLLITRGANTVPDQRSFEKPRMSSLHIAALLGRETIVQFLLERGAVVDEGKPHGRTPLYEAVCSGRRVVAQMLLNHGADPDAKGMFGCAPLHEAACRGDEEMIRLLLDRGADINIRSDYQSTPVYEAASDDHWSAMELLLSRGADVDSKAEELIKSSLERQKGRQMVQ